MSANGRFIADAIGGQQEAEALLRSLGTFFADPDSLFKCVTAALEADPSRARLRGMLRAVQKRLEQLQNGA